MTSIIATNPRDAEHKANCLRALYGPSGFKFPQASAERVGSGFDFDGFAEDIMGQMFGGKRQ